MPNEFPEQSVVLTSGTRTVQVTRIQADTKRVRLDLCDTPEDAGLSRVTFQTYPADSLIAAATIRDWIGPVDPALLAWTGLNVSEGYGQHADHCEYTDMISLMRLGGYSSGS